MSGYTPAVPRRSWLGTGRGQIRHVHMQTVGGTQSWEYLCASCDSIVGILYEYPITFLAPGKTTDPLLPVLIGRCLAAVNRHASVLRFGGDLIHHRAAGSLPGIRPLFWLGVALSPTANLIAPGQYSSGANQKKCPEPTAVPATIAMIVLINNWLEPVARNAAQHGK